MSSLTGQGSCHGIGVNNVLLCFIVKLSYFMASLWGDNDTSLCSDEAYLRMFIHWHVSHICHMKAYGQSTIITIYEVDFHIYF